MPLDYHMKRHAMLREASPCAPTEPINRTSEVSILRWLHRSTLRSSLLSSISSLLRRSVIMVAPHLLILLLNLVCLRSLRSVVAQNAGGAAAAGLVACSDDATCFDTYEYSVHCAPDGYCADAGATCSLTNQCYDDCGTDGICGGVGAACDTNDHDDYTGFKCNIGNTCTGTFTKDKTPNTGVCEPSGPSGSSAAAAGLVACSSDATCLAEFGSDSGVHCAPDGYCGDSGAACPTSASCADACGSDGICGGAGAICNTYNNDDYTGYKCAYGYTCTGTFVTGGNPTGTCVSWGPTGSQRKRRSDISPPAGMLNQPLCARLKETACMENGRSVCTDLRSDFMNCGACGNDCGEVEGAAVVACVRGKCLVGPCHSAWFVYT
ncbi:hypothetical protein CALVIDRAFT_251095 [Calocera viscosa TUFC12733]|uniref:Protein CPL1-like domain-containing protein n=1 Tax=Calocera viscosa (strain TUFC12733) TaxID=1330018 RepID=A0A167JFC9_CALVF|nr:hypothetical protein CALVIDRAFT_251095 [Calocera viscosa TUFC12733]